MVYDLQKANLWKRISAFLFDGILLCVVAVLLGLTLSAALGYDGYQQKLADAYEKYGQEYGVDFHLSTAEYEALDPEDAEKLDKAFDALSADEGAVYAYQMIITMSVLIISIGILLSCLVMEFIIPLIFGNGQTLGKKIFGLGVMRTDGVKLSAVGLFIRTFLGKYTIEIMIPVLIVLMMLWGSIGLIGPVILLSILIVQITVMVKTHTNSLIHDLISGTVAVDFASQMIFDSREAMIAYKEKIHAEQAAKAPY